MSQGRQQTKGGRPQRGNNSPEGLSARQLLATEVPPHSLEAERAVLGAILRDEDALPKAAEMLKTEHFYSDSHQKIWTVMLGLFEIGFPIDVLQVGTGLAKKEWLAHCGGAAGLTELYDETLTAANIRYNAQIIVEKAKLRAVIQAGTELVRGGYEPDGEPAAILARAEKKLAEVGGATFDKPSMTFQEIITKGLETIQARKKKPGASGMPTGYVDLDMLMGGMAEDDFVVVAARPSIGKTAFALQIAEHVSLEEEKWALFFSLEMNEQGLFERMLAGNARVRADDIRKGFYDEREELGRMMQAAAKLSQAKLHINRMVSPTIPKIKSACRRAAMKGELDLVVVDYLQLIKGGKFEKREELVAEISRSMKDLAREMRVPVIALSQLNREVEKYANKKPTMANLRESGAIEQDADTVLLLWPHDNEMTVIVEKNRNGPVGEVDLVFQKEFVRFQNKAKVGDLGGGW